MKGRMKAEANRKLDTFYWKSEVLPKSSPFIYSFLPTYQTYQLSSITTRIGIWFWDDPVFIYYQGREWLAITAVKD
jgi:hypothetical protein